MKVPGVPYDLQPSSNITERRESLMATNPKPPAKPKKPSWRDTLLQILGVSLPVILGAVLRSEPDEGPAAIFVQSEDGVGNVSISAYPQNNVPGK